MVYDMGKGFFAVTDKGRASVAKQWTEQTGKELTEEGIIEFKDELEQAGASLLSPDDADIIELQAEIIQLNTINHQIGRIALSLNEGELEYQLYD